MSSCAVATCKNHFRKTKVKGLGIVYHSFPRDPELARSWAVKCKREHAFDINRSCRICSEHFTDEDYNDDMRNRLLGLPQRKVLKSDAVPSRNLPNVVPSVLKKLNHKFTTKEKAKKLKNRKKKKKKLQKITTSVPEENAMLDNKREGKEYIVPNFSFNLKEETIGDVQCSQTNIKVEELNVEKMKGEEYTVPDNFSFTLKEETIEDVQCSQIHIKVEEFNVEMKTEFEEDCLDTSNVQVKTEVMEDAELNLEPGWDEMDNFKAKTSELKYEICCEQNRNVVWVKEERLEESNFLPETEELEDQVKQELDPFTSHHEEETVAGTKSYPCPQCREPFPLKGFLKQHIRYAHPKERFRCQECDKTFPSRQSIHFHQLSHSAKKAVQQKVYDCEICDKMFNSRAHFNAHQLKHMSLQ